MRFLLLGFGGLRGNHGSNSMFAPTARRRVRIVIRMHKAILCAIHSNVSTFTTSCRSSFATDFSFGTREALVLLLVGCARDASRRGTLVFRFGSVPAQRRGTPFGYILIIVAFAVVTSFVTRKSLAIRLRRSCATMAVSWARSCGTIFIITNRRRARVVVPVLLRMGQKGRSCGTNLLWKRIRVSWYIGIRKNGKILGLLGAKGRFLAELCGNRRAIRMLFDQVEATFLERERASKGSSFERSSLIFHGVWYLW